MSEIKLQFLSIILWLKEALFENHSGCFFKLFFTFHHPYVRFFIVTFLTFLKHFFLGKIKVVYHTIFSTFYALIIFLEYWKENNFSEIKHALSIIILAEESVFKNYCKCYITLQ